MLEGAGPIQALRRSNALVAGSWFRVFGTWIVMAVISYVLFIYQGFKTHGLGYVKHALVPPAPWFILPIPIQFLSRQLPAPRASMEVLFPLSRHEVSTVPRTPPARQDRSLLPN